MFSAKTIYERRLKAIFEKNENREYFYQKRPEVNNNGTVPPHLIVVSDHSGWFNFITNEMAIAGLQSLSLIFKHGGVCMLN